MATAPMLSGLASMIGSLLGGTTTANEGGMITMAGYSPAGTTWQSWNQVYVTGSTVTNVQTWEGWNQIYYQQTNVVTGNVAFTEPSPEEIAYREAGAKKMEEDLVRATRRAEEFLLENLDARQRESYAKHKLFIVETPKKNRYKLSHG